MPVCLSDERTDGWTDRQTERQEGKHHLLWPRRVYYSHENGMFKADGCWYGQLMVRTPSCSFTVFSPRRRSGRHMSRELALQPDHTWRNWVPWHREVPNKHMTTCSIHAACALGVNKRCCNCLLAGVSLLPSEYVIFMATIQFGFPNNIFTAPIFCQVHPSKPDRCLTHRLADMYSSRARRW